ncbi:MULTISPECIES: type 2 periplasmic-binding domain-containing protein [Shewanella]|uniref:Phosphate ABC transporter substrate-binding protein n=2 Tax=Shewanella TaxID=22 RepID=A0A974XHK5_9GAMM|nr:MULTISPECIES: phosphate ABC transporter substrate-binding protein [Shewanella]QSX28536.1 phosphate ABC transporter substrate-binding protein [Shewanella cyperi]QSX35666.1 phosphate ABC transporter substrate-binding protein [Shewanella sedimentimangrovi]QSX39297.1 phosphate ABC transporter substrate-binding protein [Shewanella cyperi]
MKSIKLLAASLTLLAPLAFAEVAVVVHPSNNDTLTSADISRIYLGKLKSFPGGSPVVPLDLKEGSDIRSQFVDKVLNKSESQLKAYWSKLVFSGQGQPPKVVENAEVLGLIAANPNMIGFMDAAAVDASVKVVARF